jgi:DNA mismatch repair protein MutL
MPDLIHLLPPNIANQIAAGEVIQRPSSAVKELLENAVDAGATNIHLIVQDAGKSLIQVVDNGKGMSDTDARNAFERHATSKIQSIDDLYKIKTMGFRGEALASIASVAQVVLKTKRPEDEIGTEIEIENSKPLRQEPCVCENGTSIAMKNLFFNVPARRNFLKSNPVELKHITDEFLHVALSFPEINFNLTSNGQEVFHLAAGTLKQRIVQIMGSSIGNKLVQVSEKTDYLDINGFIGKPETAKKTRGDQYLFVNNRFIKNAYLNHAVFSAYEELLPVNSFPFFAIFISLDPAHVDINVHPTKQEIKFDDEKIVYAFVKSAIRHALAQYSVSPALDFSLDANIQQLDAVSKPYSSSQQEQTKSGGLYKSFIDRNQAHKIESTSNLRDWKDFFETDSNPSTANAEQAQTFDFFKAPVTRVSNEIPDALKILDGSEPVQLHFSYIVFDQPRGITLLHQQLAHQQILFEQFNATWTGKALAIQQELFPQTIQFSPSDHQLITEILPDLLHMGYQLEPFGVHTFVLQGAPADFPQENHLSVIEMILEDVKTNTSTLHQSYKERISKTMARKHAFKVGVKLEKRVMCEIIDQLSRLPNYQTHFDGKPLFVEVKKDYLNNLFGI